MERSREKAHGRVVVRFWERWWRNEVPVMSVYWTRRVVIKRAGNKARRRSMWAKGLMLAS